MLLVSLLHHASSPANTHTHTEGHVTRRDITLPSAASRMSVRVEISFSIVSTKELNMVTQDEHATRVL